MQVGLTQEALARAGGTSQPAIAAYEASRLRQDPEAVLAQARRCLATMMARQQGLSQALREWGVLLERPVEALLPLFTDPDPWARELRHQTPFGGVLTGAERAEAYRAFADDEARTA